NSLESSLSFPYCAFILSVSFSRFASLFSRGLPQASLDRISNGKAFVKHFLEVFLKKIKANQRFRTMRDLPW
ncbi:hypothetical protein, partial [Aristaeella hokkaidonensis]|uniref:hypothetical protein n=1 Tax=Aristaeella hokkaidonensis TaxID=3046382 RepID=UPI0024B6F6D3